MPKESLTKPFLIGSLSSRSGVNVETIRYYERVGLLPHPSRTKGKHRSYDEVHVQRLAFIRRSRELGFSLKDTEMLLQLVDRGDVMCSGSTKHLALSHLEDVRGKLVSLKKLERALKQMTDACSPGSNSRCPILDALSPGAAARGRP